MELLIPLTVTQGATDETNAARAKLAADMTKAATLNQIQRLAPDPKVFKVTAEDLLTASMALTKAEIVDTLRSSPHIHRRGLAHRQEGLRDCHANLLLEKTSDKE
ncbi:hypothetical protein LTR10_017741 [Elasticomyces elasticus]|nr:hypothetical protein LTR10_017741 [Elasticomyces elasticus]